VRPKYYTKVELFSTGFGWLFFLSIKSENKITNITKLIQPEKGKKIFIIPSNMTDV
jgi:hypothetical protein